MVISAESMNGGGQRKPADWVSREVSVQVVVYRDSIGAARCNLVVETIGVTYTLDATRQFGPRMLKIIDREISRAKREFRGRS